MAIQHSRLLTRKQAAEYLGVKSRTLDVWACTKRYNLKFIKVGRLAKYYLLLDLITLISKNNFTWKI